LRKLISHKSIKLEKDRNEILKDLVQREQDFSRYWSCIPIEPSSPISNKNIHATQRLMKIPFVKLTLIFISYFIFA